MNNTNTAQIKKLRAAVWQYYRIHGRHDLPWRHTCDPYHILISEIMLQQTQVPRVVEKYKEFIKTFPTVHALARAPLSEVVRVWSGMGYNRRAKYVHDAAKLLIPLLSYSRRLVYEDLRTLTGVGDYTAKAVCVFAYNDPEILIETNIRAVYIHHFYASILQKTAIKDTHIIPIAMQAAQGQDPREWHWALMDYGSHIKKLYDNPARKSAHYTKQSAFEGSLRQVRGAILRTLSHNDPLSQVQLRYLVGEQIPNMHMFDEALAGLVRDGLITKQKTNWKIV
jgi:A/G-specific adenine glycosylase